MAGGPVALVVLDGWGCEAAGPGNAVALADTPVFDRLRARFPHATLEAAGCAVGLPDGQMGNSEVGHLTIGAGRVIYQDLVRVNNAIDDGSFFESEALNAAFERAQTRDASVHLLGLVSYGGVHSHIDHIRALAELARRHGLERSTHVHAFTDGRDVSPAAAVDDVAEFVTEGISVATVCGRYWAMDRDRRWERIDAALEVILGRGGATLVDPLEAIRASYAAGITDEFIEPVAVGGTPRLAEGDIGIFANFRPDRARQLSERLVQAGVDLTAMTRYSSELDCPVVFEEQDVDGTLAEVVSRAQLRQLHVAETEKYAHVTYFLNGGREEPWAGEERELVPSPADVATYDLRPEMSAAAVARAFAERVADVELSVVNFANPDMVGHTGVLPAVVRAVEEVDSCLGIVLEAVERAGGVALVFADHGNAERMLDTDCASPHTAHTTNPVPVIITRDGAELRADGTLADIAPTALGLLDLIPPAAMSGRSLLTAG